MNNTGYNPQLEAAYAASVEAVCKERDTRLAELEQRHTRFLSLFCRGPFLNLSGHWTS